MDKTQSSLLKNTVTRCRELLEASIFGVLEGKFGIYQDGRIEDISHMSHLSPDEKLNRKEIIAGFEHAKASGLNTRSALEQVVREVAFTHLNRLCAFKMLEDRKVIREAVGRGLNSNGFKFYLAEHPDDEKKWAEGQQDIAYRHFLVWLASNFKCDVESLFSPNDLANKLFPSHRVLMEVLDLLNTSDLAGIWKQDDTVGWVYQYFTPQELRDQARKESVAPRDSYELAFRNQFYTPRYVVRYLVDNTLGRAWYEMRKGTTNLTETCQYLLRSPGEALAKREKKDPRDIRIIDPACGSGHFLLYCFDVFEVIYEEAYSDDTAPVSGVTGRTLRQDYPDFNELKRHVPALILEHNLHGIDIDLRSVQITALALWMRVQRAYSEMHLKEDERPRITKSNIVCAEPMPGEEDLLDEFVVDLKPKFLGELVRKTFKLMRLAGEAGSLLKIEKAIQEAIAQAKEQWLSRPKAEQPELFPKEKGQTAEQVHLFDLSDISDESFWKNTGDRLVDALDAYAERVNNGECFIRRLFADDAIQGFAFLDVIRKRFDVVLMNPPFGTPAVNAKSHIVDNYPNSKHDLACAFVDRWLEKCEPGGRLGAITTRTPFFLSSSTNWRKKTILKDGALETFADLGYGVLDAMVETAAYTLSKGGSDLPTTFIRVLKEEDKASSLLEAINNPEDDRRFVVNPKSFSLVPNSPLCYWVSNRIRQLFVDFPPFEGDGRTVKQGLATADDFRFVRAWWEVPRENEARSREETLSGKRWVPFAKGGEYSPYYADIHLVVNWERDGEEIRNFVDPVSGRTYSRPQNVDFYFLPGLTWSDRTTSLFSARIWPSGGIFSVKGSAGFFEDNAAFTLGLMNSMMFNYLLSLLVGASDAAARSYQVGIIGVVPLAYDQRLSNAIADLATQSYHVLRSRDTNNENSRVFILPILSHAKGVSIAEGVAAYRENARQVEGQPIEIQHKIDCLAYDLYEVAQEDRSTVMIQMDRFRRLPEGHESNNDGGFNPETNFGGDAPTLVKSLLSWCIGVVFGRFDVRLATGDRPIPELGDPFDPLPIYSPGMLPGGEAPKGYPIQVDRDGILVDDEDHSDDIIRKIREVLYLLWKDQAEDIEREACAFLDVSDLRDYFRRSGKGGFFDDHIKRYSKSRRKAPIYWLLQSTRRNYGIWLYYPRLDRDILFKALETYLRPRMNRQENMLSDMKARRAGLSGAEKRNLEKEIERQEAFLDEITDFKERLEKAANFYVHPDSFEPDLNDGVVLNIAPLWEIVPWREAKNYWEELSKGKYEWSSISSQFRKRGKSGE
jgi:hypothetical protein